MTQNKLKGTLVFFLILIFIFSTAKANFIKQEIKSEILTNSSSFIGKTCYGYRASPNPDILVSFELDDPSTINMIGTSISSDKIAGGTWVDGLWWCCEYTPVNNSNIWIINHITGEMTLLGESGSSKGLHSLAYDDSTKTMYACGASNLFTINMTTGVANIIGPFGISGVLMIGIACDGYGKMYGEDLHTDSFYSINPETGHATLIGPLGLDLNYGQDMAFDKEEGICYLSAFTVHDGNEGALYTCNLSTGIPTKIGNFGSVATQITGFAIPYNLNDPPNEPIINGPINGKMGMKYYYNFSLSDPDGDLMYLMVDWGDGTPISYGQFPSGSIIMLNNTWTEKGTYKIRAQAIDSHDAESEWTTLTVTIPRHLALFNLNLFKFLYR